VQPIALQGGLKPTIRSKQKEGGDPGGILLLHNDAHLHTAAHMLETLRKLKREVIEHPAHSSGSSRKEILMWLHVKPKISYYDGIKKLVGHWKKCVEEKNDLNHTSIDISI
jgi:hypothetical protein